MKNKLKLLLLLIFLLSVTACSNVETELKNAIENNEQANNYHMKYEIEMDITTSNVQQQVPIVMNMDIDKKKEVLYSETKISAFDIDMKTIGYGDLKTNTMYSQNIETEKWEKVVLKEKILPSVNLNYSKIKKVKETKNENVYEVTIEKEDYIKNSNLLQNILKESITFNKDIVSKIYINKKTKYITKIETELTDCIDTEKEDLKYKTLRTITTYSKFNKISVDSIDEEIIKKAVYAN